MAKMEGKICELEAGAGLASTQSHTGDAEPENKKLWIFKK